MRHLFLLLIFIFFDNGIFSQAAIFSYSHGPLNQIEAQQTLITHASSIPHIGSIQYIQFSPLSSIGSGNIINLSIPTVLNGSNLQFEIELGRSPVRLSPCCDRNLIFAATRIQWFTHVPTNLKSCMIHKKVIALMPWNDLFVENQHRFQILNYYEDNYGTVLRKNIT